jgi:hypothetical protein
MKVFKGVSAAALAAALGLALAACGSSNNTSGGGSTTTTTGATPTTSLNPQVATAAVTTLFVNFFDGTNQNLQQRLMLLDNYKKYSTLFFKLYNTPVAKSVVTKAKVDAVAFPTSAQCQIATKSAVCAKVTYDLVSYPSGSSLLAGQGGYAAYHGGQWLVADSTFCSLASLAIQGVSCTV